MMSTARRSVMVATRTTENVKALLGAVSERRMLKESELLRDYINAGLARDIVALAPREEPR
jgi:hypothetical protein